VRAKFLKSESYFIGFPKGGLGGIFLIQNVKRFMRTYLYRKNIFIFIKTVEGHYQNLQQEIY
jgi:hypothetical protein